MSEAAASSGAWKLSTATAAASVIGVVTAPLQARALGVEGRGELAAVVVPTAVAGWLALVGQGPYISRQVAAGAHIGRLLVSTSRIWLVAAIVVAVTSPLLASVLGDGRETVVRYLTIGLACTPVLVATHVVYDINVGLRRWTSVSLMVLVPAVLLVTGVVLLFSLDRLTVASAATLAIASNIAAVLAGVGALTHVRAARAPRSETRTALGFGVRAWSTDLLNLTNSRLDQVVMLSVVGAAQLGLYAVSVTISVVAGFATNVFSTMILPQVAAAGPRTVPRALRSLIFITAVLGVVFAVASPVALYLFFGETFLPATPLVVILLAAGVPLAATTMLTAVSNAMLTPSTAARAQALSVAITVIGLLILLPRLGALGAAITSVVAYTAAFTVLVARIRPLLDRPGLRELLVVQRSDLAWIWSLSALTLMRRLRRR